MGIINSNKSIGGITSIDCQGILDVTIGIVAAPDISTNPTDIVLVLDRSTSMNGQPLADMKTGANAFIDIIAAATAGAPGEIGSGSSIGIVSFATTAVQNTGLITSVADLKAAVAALTAGGSTNHGAAFTEAAALLSASTNDKVIVMFTDGETTTGPAPSPIAAAAKAQGISIYCIGLIGSGGIDVSALNDWSTDPDVTHVAIAPDSSQLEQIFADLAANISVPGATDIVINEAINPDFVIVNPPVANVGTISQLTDTTFQWSIDQLGTTASESATVSFAIRHIADDGGVKLVDELLSYADSEGNVVSFADPSVTVNCIPEVAMLSVVKSADKTSVSSANEVITYTLVVSNTGNLPISGVVVHDSIPQGLCYQPGTTRINGGAPTDANPQYGITVGDLAPAQVLTVTFALKMCTNPCCGISVTEFVNTAWAQGISGETTVNALSAPWVVTLEGYYVKYVEKSFRICDYRNCQQAYLYYTNTTYHPFPTGGSVNAGYGIAVKYVSRYGEIKTRYFEGSEIFSNLPVGFDYAHTKVRFVDLEFQCDCCGNANAKFEAILCHCD